jgi:hypothetical protein
VFERKVLRTINGSKQENGQIVIDTRCVINVVKTNRSHDQKTRKFTTEGYFYRKTANVAARKTEILVGGLADLTYRAQGKELYGNNFSTGPNFKLVVAR